MFWDAQKNCLIEQVLLPEYSHVMVLLPVYSHVMVLKYNDLFCPH